MLKFRFPTTKRNTQQQQQQQQQQEQEQPAEIVEQDQQQTTPSPSPSNSSNHHHHHHHQQQNTQQLIVNHPQLIQSTDSIEHTDQSEDHSLPINLHNNKITTTQTTHVSRKIRRKSYGGLRAMLGINKQEDHHSHSPPPPLPLAPSSACSTNFQHQQIIQQQHHLHRHHKHNPSLDASSSTSSLSNIAPMPSSPVANNLDQPRQTTSSLRPFPFLGGIRRKSANATNIKSPHPLTTHQTNDPTPNSYPSPSNSQSPSVLTIVNNNHHHHHQKSKNPKIKASDYCTRIYANGSTKKAQSVDDLSQFGLLPKPRIQPRRSEELGEHRQGGPNHGSSSVSADEADRADPRDLHNRLDQIGEMAGSLAAINRTPTTEDRLPPRLSNPKGMRTVYGVPIEDLYWRDGDSFPLLVDVLVDLIEEKGLDQQGIYRVPGEKRVIENLQASIDEKGVRGVDIWRDSYKDVHNLSGALKLFLREIPGGVIPFDRYDRFLAVNAVADDSERTSQLQSHVKDLPLPNKILLLKLIKHFERVVAHAEANSMLAHNVAIVFAPSLFRNGSEHSNPLLSMQNIGKASAIVRHIVLNAAQIFEETSEELMKQAAMETVRAQKDKKQQQGQKRRSINMNLNHYPSLSPQFNKHQPLKSTKEDGPTPTSKRASVSSVLTNTTATTMTDELRKSRRGSAAAATTTTTNSSSTTSKKKSGNTGSSKRNTARLNSALSASTKPSKPSNRHSLTGSILSSSSNKSSRSNKPSNSNTTSAHSSLADATLILPSSAPSPISPSDTTSPLSSSSTTPHPTLGFGNLTVKKKNTK
ncbi:hypothetical protein PCANC_18008 [Puccinia coronata f. sp. avenae]|uniref:Rho-GAP domain-containing protein n=1 Tax=Puccinia coronata f. sp. avenae TaxID=200324 RepID=A0A2N5SJ60_9BASI|nr:hypothetical protein PCANC_18008 [Puccinia coronata f. sp. avenae]